jgi:hypothetical protein
MFFVRLWIVEVMLTKQMTEQNWVMKIQDELKLLVEFKRRRKP